MRLKRKASLFFYLIFLSRLRYELYMMVGNKSKALSRRDLKRDSVLCEDGLSVMDFLMSFLNWRHWGG